MGPAGNRNRVIPHLEPGDIVMFVDADMKLITTDMKTKITRLFETNPDVAMFGGGIQDKYGKPMPAARGQTTSAVKEREIKRQVRVWASPKSREASDADVESFSDSWRILGMAKRHGAL